MAGDFPIPEDGTSEADPPESRTNPRPITPDTDPALEPNPAPEASLVEDMGELVDDLRQMYTDFGLRPYRLFSIVTNWTGGAKGRGDQVIKTETELLPTPLITNVDSLRGDLKSGGNTERGGVRVSEISPRFTEDDIREIFHLQPLPAGHEAFLEMRVDGRDGNTIRRRFTIQGAPWRRADRFDWTIRLLEQDPMRSRRGVLEAP